jgi:hypothetical protein
MELSDEHIMQRIKLLRKFQFCNVPEKITKLAQIYTGRALTKDRMKALEKLCETIEDGFL